MLEAERGGQRDEPARKEQRSRAIPGGDGLGFVLKGIGRSKGGGVVYIRILRSSKGLAGG